MLQKKYEDYLPALYELFPDIKEDSIKSIIEHGLKKIYSLVKLGNDIKMQDKQSSIFIGWPQSDPKIQWVRSKVKEHYKRRRIFLDQKCIWDGWHYFGVTEEENCTFKGTGELPLVDLYRILKECIIRKGIKYIYRIDLGYSLPEKAIPWRESKENIKFIDCEFSEEGKKILDSREYKKTFNLKYKK